MLRSPCLCSPRDFDVPSTRRLEDPGIRCMGRGKGGLTTGRRLAPPCGRSEMAVPSHGRGVVRVQKKRGINCAALSNSRRPVDYAVSQESTERASAHVLSSTREGAKDIG